MTASIALLTAAVLVSLAALGLLLHGSRRTGTHIAMGLAGVALTFATIAAARRLEAAAQFWILLVALVFLAEFLLLRNLERGEAEHAKQEDGE